VSKPSPPRRGPASRKPTRRLPFLGAGLILLPALALAGGVVGNGNPTLCTEPNLDSVLSGGGTVTFDCGPSPFTIPVTAEKAIADDTEIDGGDLITLSGGGTTRIFNVASGKKLTLERITLAHGSESPAVGEAQGGAILCAGCNLEIQDSTFADNSTHASQSKGGAIWFGPPAAGGDSGSLLIARSTFSGNIAESNWSYGGAIFATLTGATGSIVASTFSGNSSAGGTTEDHGGAIFATGSQDLLVVNCTFSGNAADDGGSGIYSQISPGSVVLRNSIVANGVGSANCAGNSGSITDGGHNLQFGGTVADSCGAGISTPLGDPLGGNSLADNGGVTETIALPSGSAAIDAGDATICSKTLPDGPDGADQRGWADVNTCDIGAFEYAAVDPAPVDVPLLGVLGLLALISAVAGLAVLALRRV
jgi:hypothetical protein